MTIDREALAKMRDALLNMAKINATEFDAISDAVYSSIIGDESLRHARLNLTSKELRKIIDTAIDKTFKLTNIKCPVSRSSR